MLSAQITHYIFAVHLKTKQWSLFFLCLFLNPLERYSL